MPPERFADEGKDGGALTFLPRADPGELSLARIDLEMGSPALVEPEELARDTHEALAATAAVRAPRIAALLAQRQNTF
jgi:hypothetical protein